MNKKSQAILIILVQLILVLLIFFSFLSATNKIKNSTFFQQKTFSKNIALFYDSVMSSPYKTEASLQLHPDYNMEIDMDEDCLVKTFAELKSASTFYCGLNLYSDTECSKKINCDYQKNFIAFKNA